MDTSLITWALITTTHDNLVIEQKQCHLIEPPTCSDPHKSQTLTLARVTSDSMCQWPSETVVIKKCVSDSDKNGWLRNPSSLECKTSASISPVASSSRHEPKSLPRWNASFHTSCCNEVRKLKLLWILCLPKEWCILKLPNIIWWRKLLRWCLAFLSVFVRAFYWYWHLPIFWSW